MRSITASIWSPDPQVPPITTGVEPGARRIDRGEVSITAGASAPEKLVDEVIEAFAQRYEIKVEARVTAKENIAFNIPRELRAIEAAVAK